MKIIKRKNGDKVNYYNKVLEELKVKTEWQLKKTTYGQQPFNVR